MCSTKRNSTRSKLLALPAELRNKIYGYVVGGNLVMSRAVRPIQECFYESPKAPTVPSPRDFIVEPLSADLRSIYTMTKDDPPRLAPLASMLSICRQIAKESKGLLFSRNTFVIDSNDALTEMKTKFGVKDCAFITEIAITESYAKFLVETNKAVLNFRSPFALDVPHCDLARALFPNLKRIFVVRSPVWDEDGDERWAESHRPEVLRAFGVTNNIIERCKVVMVWLREKEHCLGHLGMVGERFNEKGQWSPNIHGSEQSHDGLAQ